MPAADDGSENFNPRQNAFLAYVENSYLQWRKQTETNSLSEKN